LAVAAYCDRRTEEGLAWKDVFKLLILAGIPIVLVMAQPDLGTAIIMVIVLLVMLAVAGLPARILVMLIVAACLVILGAVETGLLHPFQIARFTTFLHPNSTSSNPFVQSAKYNLQQAKSTIASGGFFGTGIGRGTQTNLGYVPEQQTDFIFTAVAEQLGFVGAAGLLTLLGIIAWRILRSAGTSRDIFGRLVCTGLFTFVAFSVFQNSGMTMGIMPITGIPLPFVSYGGTAVLCFFVCVGLALSVGARRRMR
jgi:rod shape determining protein RodA